MPSPGLVMSPSSGRTLRRPRRSSLAIDSRSRYGKGEGSDYWNCPLSEPEYARFIQALLSGLAF